MRSFRFVVPLVIAASLAGLVHMYLASDAAGRARHEPIALEEQPPRSATGGRSAAADAPSNRERDDRTSRHNNTNPAAHPHSVVIDTIDRLFAGALDNNNGEARRMALRGIAEYLADHDVERAKDYIGVILNLKDASAQGDAYTFTKVFADRLAARNPEAAARWADVLPDALKEVTYQFVARHWLGVDPQALSRWASSLPTPALRASVIRSIGQQLLQSDPTGFAPDWASSLARTEDGPRFSDIVVKHWARTDPDAAWEWCAGLENPDDRNRAFLALGETIAERDPLATINRSANLRDGELRDRMIQEAIAQWASQDPAAAANWVATHGSQAGVERSFHHIAGAWMRKDPLAASRWIQQAPVSREMKDYVLTTMSTRVQDSR